MTKEDFVLVFHNNEGKKNGYDQKWLEWPDNVLNYIRNPAFVSLGKYMPNAFQPIWFEAPTEILNTDEVPIPPRSTTEVATYPSLTHWQGKTVLWYPDRKTFLLGKNLSELLKLGY